MKLMLNLFYFMSISMWSIVSANEYSQDGYPLSSAIWNSPTIPVCWEDFSDSSNQQRQWVRNAVANSWEAFSNVSFTGWGECNNNSDGIRIAVADVGPHTASLGNNLDGVVNGMVLNFTYTNWSPSCQNSVQFCSEVIAVHEFGHALGFAHEQNRPDTPDTCQEPAQGSNGDITVGAWDLHSVMNYCNPNWNGDGKLSDTDIEMVVKYYGGLIQSDATNGYWGDWGAMVKCPAGQYVYGYRLRSESPQGDGDDTALNDIELYCAQKFNSQYTTIYSDYNTWGTFSSDVYCSGGDNPVVGFDMKIESPQGSGDDTAANDIDLYCKLGGYISASVNTSWGSWTSTVYCPAGQAVTGLATRVEEPQGGDDDTSLNGLRLWCSAY